jgi:TolB-like protein/Tfp pilus assembly protein PilF
MKRCPECGREYDNTMAFCLDDGAELLYGPASMDEPATELLSELGATGTGRTTGESSTRAHIHTTDRTAILPAGHRLPKTHGFDKRLLLVGLLVAVLVVGSVFGYRYLALPKQIESIAVMPFVNETGTPDLEYLSDGMTETLIKSLAQVPNLAVKSRSTVFYYKGKETSPKTIGEELGVQAVLLGRVGGRGDDLKLSVELVNTQTQNVIWSEQYDRKQSGLVTLQSEVAKDVAAELSSRLSRADEAEVTKTPTSDPEAYQAYLKGRYYWNRRTTENLKKAIEQFKSAADKDPNYALAYSGLADCYAILGDYAGNPASETGPQARAFAERAVVLDDRLAEPHATLGILNMQLFQWAEAEKESKRAVDLNPDYPTGLQWYGSILLDFGKYDEAAVIIKRAAELDPLSGSISNGLTSLYQAKQDYNAAIANSLKFIELDPTFPASYRDLSLSYSKSGRCDEALSPAEKAAALGNRASWLLGDLGYVYAACGKRNEALATAKELEIRYARNETPSRYVAAVYAGLGENDKALEWLEKDLQNKNGRLAEIRWTIPFQSLHDDPRFQDIFRRMGMPN